MPSAYVPAITTVAVLYCSVDEDVWGVGFRVDGGIESKVYTTRAGVEAMRDACNAILAAHPDVGVR